MEHYFTNNPDLKSELREISFAYKGHDFLFMSDNGVFSKNKIDYASHFLLDCFFSVHNVENTKKVLDVGCGYGLLGIVLSCINKYSVDMIDVNKRAVHLSEMNINKNKCDAKVFESNIFSNVTDKYDYIITNPPIRAGKRVVYDILLGAKEFLNKDGELWCVINKDQGAKSTKKELEKCYNVEVVAKSKGFYVFKAKIC